jgi:hypothetical protein
MVVLAQLVRASVCGTEGRGFEPHIPPASRKTVFKGCFSSLQWFEGHSRDTLRIGYSPMKPYTTPIIRHLFAKHVIDAFIKPDHVLL